MVSISIRYFLIFSLITIPLSSSAQLEDSLIVVSSPEGNLGYRKEFVKKRRTKCRDANIIVVKGYYQEVIALGTHMDPPQPAYGRKKRFRRVESTIRDRQFRRKFGI